MDSPSGSSRRQCLRWASRLLLIVGAIASCTKTVPADTARTEQNESAPRSRASPHSPAADSETEARKAAPGADASIAAKEPIGKFDSLEYVATYGGMPAASAGLVLRANGEATLRFDGNENAGTPLFPKIGRATKQRTISPEQRAAIEAALAVAKISEPINFAPAPGPIATGDVKLVIEGKPVALYFPLYEPTPRFLPLRDALGAAIAAMLSAQ